MKTKKEKRKKICFTHGICFTKAQDQPAQEMPHNLKLHNIYVYSYIKKKASSYKS